MRRLKILDWYVHQGHQYEFSKIDHDIHLVGANGGVPNWNKEHRPLRDNVKLISEKQAKKFKYDIVMIRSPIPEKRYIQFITRKTQTIAVVQTTSRFYIPKYCKHVVWNSADVMNENKDFLRKKKHHYIVHGYDPDEFYNLNLKRNNRVLTVANVFKGRSQIMGYNLWYDVRQKIDNIDIVGHGNKDIPFALKEASSLKDLVRIYNTYSVYLNTTRESAMPRSRCEAMFCGIPVITTSYYDINRYIKHGKNGFLANTSEDMIKHSKYLLENPEVAAEIGEAGRKTAIKHFHVDDYISKWHSLFERMT